MARAGLTIAEEIQSTFLSAQENDAIRALQVTISDEALVLARVMEKGGDVHADFDTNLGAILADNEASLVVFRFDDEPVNGAYRWVLLAWVPDSAKVRDKMLYSSSRDDLKRTLGLTHFVTEYYANSKSDLSFAAVLEAQNKDREAAPLTEAERLRREERALTSLERDATTKSAMSIVQFALSDTVKEELNMFTTGDCNWVEMRVDLDKETIESAGSKIVIATEPLAPHLTNEDGRFLALRLPDSKGGALTMFVYSCPETLPIRMKMTLSTVKSAAIAAAQELGVTFDKTFEIRDTADLDHYVQAELNPPEVTVGSSAAQLSHSKPARPGRGARRVVKAPI